MLSSRGSVRMLNPDENYLSLGFLYMSSSSFRASGVSWLRMPSNMLEVALLIRMTGHTMVAGIWRTTSPMRALISVELWLAVAMLCRRSFSPSRITV